MRMMKVRATRTHSGHGRTQTLRQSNSCDRSHHDAELELEIRHNQKLVRLLGNSLATADPVGRIDPPFPEK